MFLNDLAKIARIDALRYVSGGEAIKAGVDDRAIDVRQAPIGGVETGPDPGDG